MKSYEDFVSAESDYFVYMPSVTAQRMFFYPLYTGHFFMMPDIHYIEIPMIVFF